MCRFGHRSLLLRLLPCPRLILALAQIHAQGVRLTLAAGGQLGTGRGRLWWWWLVSVLPRVETRPRRPSRRRTGEACAAPSPCRRGARAPRAAAIGHRALVEIGADQCDAARLAATRPSAARVNRALGFLAAEQAAGAVHRRVERRLRLRAVEPSMITASSPIEPPTKPRWPGKAGVAPLRTTHSRGRHGSRARRSCGGCGPCR